MDSGQNMHDDPGTLSELAELLVAEADARLINTYKVQPSLIEAFRERLRLDREAEVIANKRPIAINRPRMLGDIDPGDGNW